VWRERKTMISKTGCFVILVLSLTAWGHELAPDPSEQKLSELLARIGIKRGNVVAEVTSGIGFRLEHFVDTVGSEGVVYALAFHQENVDKIREKAKQKRWNNIRPTLGSHVGEQVNLPVGEIEWIVVMDSYHHFRAAEVLPNLRKSLASNGKLAVVEVYSSRRHPTVPADKLRTHVKLDRDDVIAKVQNHGFVLERQFDSLSYQYVAVFRKATN